jgi:hypothetical protein
MLLIPAKNWYFYKGGISGSIVWLAILVTLLSVAQANAQNVDDEDWVRGALVFQSGDTASGNLYINVEQNLVQLEQGKGIKTFAPASILLVRTYNPAVLYTVHNAALQGTRLTPTLFEVIQPGAYATLLGRELSPRTVMATLPYGGMAGPGLITTGPFYNYFVLTDDGKVYPVPLKRKELDRLFNGQDGSILHTIARSQKTNPTLREDIIRFLQIYNEQKLQGKE